MEFDALFPVPVIQGPMAGGACTPELVAAVSNAGGLGALPGSLLAPQVIEEQVARIRSLTSRPFLLNFFIQGTPAPSEDQLAQAGEFLRPIWESLGWSELPRPKKWCEDFAAQFETLLALRPAVASFTFGILGSEQVERLHAADILVIGTVTTVEEALAWQAIGADAVVASGVEAGGHRGTFIGRQEDATLTASALWPQVVQAVRIPVIAAGGIMDGADIRRALALGARAVQMGSAFLVTDESGIHPAYKARLLAGADQTRLTRSFSGRYARGIENRFMRQMAQVERQVPPYPVQNALTGSIRAAAAASGDTELMSLWAGTGYARARPMPAARLVELLAFELQS
ncbi:nitronate monooxygenase [Massilia sp. Dwa41.01b]|uniref:NAD(P)H-dependent flavin oxidoreductase n=1 Tax=unclassified Massilia TaxID=2609279 RepID=UPI001600401D|nr:MULTISPECIES: nitronate monooxygenase [unclassified Massilia]QNA87249.1 nitronate monooxygenase [Massilia sp. Dwa41.01b]QNA98154.1 nitronate monooxygenase [Massilia sp. Se16.2.3]